MKIVVHAPYDWRPRRQYIKALKPSDEPQTVTRACGEAAIAAGAATLFEPDIDGASPNEAGTNPSAT